MEYFENDERGLARPTKNDGEDARAIIGTATGKPQEAETQ